MAKVPQLRLTNICKKYGSNTVLDNINLNVQPGEILFLVGKNGGGKSTLFNIILNLIFPDQGSVEINSARQNVGSCLTSLTLFPNKNAFENLKYYAMQLGIKKFEISLNPLFPLFTDEYKKPVKGFSSGMKKSYHWLSLFYLRILNYCCLMSQWNSLICMQRKSLRPL